MEKIIENAPMTDEHYFKTLMSVILPKSDLIMMELRHTLISLTHPMSNVQDAATHDAIRGALISGMKATIEKLIADKKLK